MTSQSLEAQAVPQQLFSTAYSLQHDKRTLHSRCIPVVLPPVHVTSPFPQKKLQDAVCYLQQPFPLLDSQQEPLTSSCCCLTARICCVFNCVSTLRTIDALTCLLSELSCYPRDFQDIYRKLVGALDFFFLTFVSVSSN